MKAEIGFACDLNCNPTSRLSLVIQGQSRTEHTSLQLIAKRMGWLYDQCSGELIIEEPATPAAILPDGEAR